MEAIAISHVFRVYAKHNSHFPQQHSLSAATANIIKCLANIRAPLHSAHAYTNKHTCKNQLVSPSLPSCLPTPILPLSPSSWVSQWQCTRERVHWSAKVSSHFTGASLCSAHVPEWELLISPDCLEYGTVVGSPAGERQGEGKRKRGSECGSQGPGQDLAGNR